MTLTDHDIGLLRQAIDLSRSAAAHGNHLPVRVQPRFARDRPTIRSNPDA